MADLSGKVVVVTGAGGGIGRETALTAARLGAKVVVNDIGASLSGQADDPGAADKVVAEIQAEGGSAAASTHSVADAEGAAAIVATALDAFGRIDGVVNNAGILRDKLFHKMAPSDFEAVVQVHLMGSFYVSNAAARAFREQGGGAYVHMTSTSGLIGNLGQANYAAAKLGIVGLSRSIAIDMERFGVRSNALLNCTAASSIRPRASRNSPYISCAGFIGDGGPDGAFSSASRAAACTRNASAASSSPRADASAASSSFSSTATIRARHAVDADPSRRWRAP